MARNRALLNVSIVGAGRVGTALAVLMRRKGFRIVSVVSRSKASARRLGVLVGCRNYSHNVANIHPSTEFLLIATADEAISTVARSVARLSPLDFPRLIAAHTSGLFTSDELASLERKGTTTFSLHPMQTFPPYQSLHRQLRAFPGISYGVEGSPAARRVARTIVTRLGGKMLEVPKEEKISYHLACVFASNYSVALLGAVHDIANTFAALRHFEKLVKASVQNAFDRSPQQVLTGPIARGSIKAVERHLRGLRKKHKGLVDIYKSVGLYALELAKRAHRLTPATVQHMKRALSR